MAHYQLLRTTLDNNHRDIVARSCQHFAPIEQQHNGTHANEAAVKITEQLDCQLGGNWHGIIGPHYTVFSREDPGTLFQATFNGEQVYTFWKNAPQASIFGNQSTGAPPSADIITVAQFEFLRCTLPDEQRNQVTLLVQQHSQQEEQTGHLQTRQTASQLAHVLDDQFGPQWHVVIGPH